MKDKLIIRHSSIIVNDYNLGDCEKIEKQLSIWDPVYFTMKPFGYYYDEENKRLYLPRGLDIYYLERLFNTKAVIDYVSDKYKSTNNPIMIKYMPRDDVQKEALRFLLGKGEYSPMERKSQQSLNLSTGKGKTYCSIATIAYCNIKSAVITYSIDWLNQWKKCFYEYTDLPNNSVKIVNSSSTINKFLNDPKSADRYDVFLFTHSTLKSYGDENGWNKISELFKILGIGLKFYDECHLNFTNMCMIDFFTNTFKTYYVSASPARSDADENRIYKLYLKNVPAIELFDAENDPHTSYVSIKFDSRPTPFQKSKCRNQYGLSATAYCDYVVHQPNFLKMMDIIMDMCFKVKGKCLLYFATNKGIEVIYNWMIKYYPEIINDIGIFSSLSGDNKKENLNKKFILTTIKSAGAAVDIKGLSMVIIAASPFKSEVTMQQVLGRTRDDNTMCIELLDVAFNQIIRWYYHKKNIIEKYALDVSNSKFSISELDYTAINVLEQRYYDNMYACRMIQEYTLYKVVSFIPKGQKQKVVTMHRRPYLDR